MKIVPLALACILIIMMAAAAPAQAIQLPAGKPSGTSGGVGFASVSCVINGLYAVGVGPLDIWSCAGAAALGGSACFPRPFQADYCVSAGAAFAGGIGVGVAGPDGTVVYEAAVAGTGGSSNTKGSCSAGLPFAVAECGGAAGSVGGGDCFTAEATATATSLGGDSGATGEGATAACADKLGGDLHYHQLIISDPRTCSFGSTEPSRDEPFMDLDLDIQDGVMAALREAMHAKLDDLYVEPTEVSPTLDVGQTMSQAPANPHIIALWDSWHQDLDDILDIADGDRASMMVSVWDC